MCYKTAVTQPLPELENRFYSKAEHENVIPERSWNIDGFTHPNIPVITNHDPEVIKSFSWGLIPFWAKDEKVAKEIRTKTLNAKAETVFSLPSFRDAVKSKRCLILVDHIIEFHHYNSTTKLPFAIHLPNKQPFALAGLWSSWTNKETGEVHNTCSIVTTEANGLMSFVHNSKKRMPVILTRETEKLWLQDLPKTDLEGLLKPYQEEMQAYTIAPFLGKTNYERAASPLMLAEYTYEQLGKPVFNSNEFEASAN